MGRKRRRLYRTATGGQAEPAESGTKPSVDAAASARPHRADPAAPDAEAASPRAGDSAASPARAPGSAASADAGAPPPSAGSASPPIDLAGATALGPPVCQICGDPIIDRKVWCVDCETLHHRDCFAWNGRCSVFGCTGMRFRSQPGRDPGVKWIEVRDEQGDLHPQGYVVEFTSHRESVSAVGALLAIILGLVVSISEPKGSHRPWPYSPQIAWPLLAAGAVLALVRVGLRDYRIIDGKSRTIWLHRSFYRWKRLIPEVTFDQVRGLVMEGRLGTRGKRRETGLYWRLRLDLRSGRSRKLTDEEFEYWDRASSLPAPPPPALRETGRRVANILGHPLEVDRPRIPGWPRERRQVLFTPRFLGAPGRPPFPAPTRGGPPAERRDPRHYRRGRRG